MIILHPNNDWGKGDGAPALPTRQETYRTAQNYRKSGLSFLPIRADGTKMPAFELLPEVRDEKGFRNRRTWSVFRNRRPTGGEVRSWYLDPPGEYGLAVIGGAVSGGLEMIDCDSWSVAVRWVDLVDQKAPGLIEDLVLVQSPRPGLHAYYRSNECGGNQKLARVSDPQNAQKPKTVIEIKGEGGYCLAPPSPAACHSTGRRYEVISARNLTQIPTVRAEDRAVLIGCARELNERIEPVRQRPLTRTAPSSADCLRPGDDFNLRADWGQILEPHGWRWVHRDVGGCDHWGRPGKSQGSSATTNYAGHDVLYVFSSNAEPFEQDTGYSKFSAYALLEHDGDYCVAAGVLAKLGYGRSDLTPVASHLCSDVPSQIRRAFLSAIACKARRAP